MSATQDRQELLAAMQQGIDAHPNNSRKWVPLKKWFAQRFGTTRIPDDKAADGKFVTTPKQVWNRLHNELPGNDPKYAVITAADDGLLPSIRDWITRSQYPRAHAFLLLQGTSPVELQVFRSDEVTGALEEMFPELTPQYIHRPEHGPPPGGSVHPVPAVAIPIQIDPRVKRMVLLSIQSSTAVILVGPPGTGKTTLLNQVVEEIRANPASFGFSNIAEPMRATPEESWTTSELVGGQTIAENQQLRFRPGLVLEAIQGDRWLILDEVNRADMDKIFGGLLTWLSSNEDVDLGPVSTHLDSARVAVGWNAASNSEVNDAQLLADAHPAGGPVRFLAGEDWRLLGTYNAVDAQRVFRFGAALGRRFARVPIPAPDETQFATALQPLSSSLPPAVHSTVVGLYGAHHKEEPTRLGPALFMRIPRYVQQGLPQGSTDAALLTALISEGYLVSVGTWLSKMRADDRSLLGDEIVNARQLMPLDEWEWIVEMAAVLG